MPDSGSGAAETVGCCVGPADGEQSAAHHPMRVPMHEVVEWVAAFNLFNLGFEAFDIGMKLFRPHPIALVPSFPLRFFRVGQSNSFQYFRIEFVQCALQ